LAVTGTGPPLHDEERFRSDAMRCIRTVVTSLVLWLTITGGGFAQTSQKPPETFHAEAQVLGRGAGSSAQVTIRIEQYSEERDRKTMQDALKDGGFAAFLPALRKAPPVGFVEMHGRTVAVRWAHEQKTAQGRTISVVAERPLYFVGGGDVDAKPREGFEVAVILLDVDLIGLGKGSMAPAARVQPGGPTGVQIEDYAEKAVTLVTVRRAYR
jgi:hypothetical protein